MSDFWTRRRAAVDAEAEAEIRADESAARAEREAALAERTDDDLLAELDLPDPDSLTDAGQVRDFLHEAVPQRLKTRALRRLWQLNPVLANLDGLVDYGEDFTDTALVVDNLQTAYRVGKGMVARLAEPDPDGPAPDGGAPAPETTPDPTPVPTPETTAEPAARTADKGEADAPDAPGSNDAAPEMLAGTGHPVQEFGQTAAVPPNPRARRMRFTFEDQRTG